MTLKPDPKNTHILQADELNVLDIISTIIVWRKTIVGWVLFITLIAIIISLVMPESYQAKAVLLPSQSSPSFFDGITKSLGIEGVGDLLGAGGSDQTFRLKAILQSRTLAERTIKKFNLQQRYKEKLFDDALKDFAGHIDIKINEDGTMAIATKAKTEYFHLGDEGKIASKLAADMANYMVGQLDEINKELMLRKARFEKNFIQKRFDKTKHDLDSVEVNLKNFGEKYDLISLPDQLKALIEISSQLDAQILMKDVELNVMKGYLKPNHPKYIQLKSEISELNKKLKSLKKSDLETKSISLLPSFNDIPELALQYINLKRNVEVQGLLYQFLAQQLEQTKLQEARNTPTIQVLDYAHPPQRRTSPWRSLIVILAAIIGTFVGVAHAFIKEKIRNLKKVKDDTFIHFQKNLSEMKNSFFSRKKQ